MPSTVSALQNVAQSRKREVATGKVQGNQPGGHEVDEVMEEIGVADPVHGRIHGQKEEEQAGDVAQPTKHVSKSTKLSLFKEGGSDVDLEVTLGTICPQVKVSTRRMKGIIDKTL